MYQRVPVTDRIHTLRKIYKKLPIATEKRPFYYSGDRWISLAFLESWANPTRGVTTKLRRAYAEAAELDGAKPVIFDGELIVGQLYFPEYTDSEKERFGDLYTRFQMVQSAHEMNNARTDHIALDYEKLLKVGVRGLMDEIKNQMNALNLADSSLSPDNDILGRIEFYNCALIEFEALERLIKRYEDHALYLAESASALRKRELLTIAKTLAVVPMNPAHSFREAVQSVHFYTYNLFGLYPLGRPDRYLYPYYQQDIKNGDITPAEAQELIDQLCLLVSTYVFSRAACGFIVGGRDSNDVLVENELTYMFITALEHIYMPDPNGALAVTEDTSDELLFYAAEVLGKGTTHPAFFNDRVITESLIRHGIEAKDAHEYIHSTCAEISIAGKSKMYTTPYVIDMPRTFMNMIECRKFENIDEIITVYHTLLTNMVNEKSLQYHLRIREAARNGLESNRACCLVNDCIARGKNVYENGAKYSMLQPIFVGFSNVIDSLLAIEQIVFREKRLSFQAFLDIVMNDYKDNEPLRQYIIHHCPHYGNDIPDADQMAERIANGIADIFHRNDVYGVRNAMPGTFSYVTHAFLGAAFGATPDGRRAHTSYADGCGPVQGYDISGPTALINSLTSWDQSDFLAGMVVNVKFGRSTFDQAKQKNFVHLVRTFMARGGIEMQVNVINAEILKDAVVNPEQHSDLIVRIGGFSDYFVKQTPVMQAEIIKRTEY